VVYAALLQRRQTASAVTDSVVPALRTFMQGDVARNDEFLRTEALAALLRHKDDSVVEAAESELLAEHCLLEI